MHAPGGNVMYYFILWIILDVSVFMDKLFCSSSLFFLHKDGNGASSSFFWVKPDRSLYPTERNELPTIQRLNNRYSLFAHVTEGNDVLELLRPGDVLVRYCLLAVRTVASFF
jgi:hypothetical protein